MDYFLEVNDNEAVDPTKIASRCIISRRNSEWPW